MEGMLICLISKNNYTKKKNKNQFTKKINYVKIKTIEGKALIVI